MEGSLLENINNFSRSSLKKTTTVVKTTGVGGVGPTNFNPLGVTKGEDLTEYYDKPGHIRSKVCSGSFAG